MNKPKLVVGQRLWFVDGILRRSREVTVVKVGRVWATLDYRGYRMDLRTWRVDRRGGARAYLSKKEYEDERLLLQEWRSLLNEIDRDNNRILARISLETIKEIRLKLGL